MNNKNRYIVGRIKAGLKNDIPVYKHSGVCVIGKTSVTVLTGSSFKFGGELPKHLQIIKEVGLVLHKDFFTVNKALAIQITGSSQICKDTILFTLSGLRKFLTSPLMNELGAERTKDAIKQLEIMESKLFKKATPAIDVVIKDESVTNKTTPKVIKLEDALNKDVIDVIVDRVIDRIADQAMERLLLRA